MNDFEVTWHYRIWLALIVIIVLIICFVISAKLDNMAEQCFSYTIDLEDLEIKQ